jgi:hypothetical protein
MPGGKPGDHPYSDIVVHGWSGECGPEISDLVRELTRTPGFLPYRDEVAGLTEQCSSFWSNNPTNETRTNALARLSKIKAILESGVQK